MARKKFLFHFLLRMLHWINGDNSKDELRKKGWKSSLRIYKGNVSRQEIRQFQDGNEFFRKIKFKILVSYLVRSFEECGHKYFKSQGSGVPRNSGIDFGRRSLINFTRCISRGERPGSNPFLFCKGKYAFLGIFISKKKRLTIAILKTGPGTNDDTFLLRNSLDK